MSDGNELARNQNLICSRLAGLLRELFRHKTLKRDDIFVFVATGLETDPYIWQSRKPEEEEGRNYFDELVKLAQHRAGLLSERDLEKKVSASGPVIQNLPWLAEVLDLPIMVSQDQKAILGWVAKLPDIGVGFAIGEWRWDLLSHNSGVVPEVIETFRKTVSIGAILPEGSSFLSLYEGLQDRVFAPYAEGLIEYAIQKEIVDSFDSVLIDRRWDEIRSTISSFKAVTQATMEQKSVSGGLVIGYSETAIDDVKRSSKTFHVFDQPFDLIRSGKRTILKLISLTDGSSSFILSHGTKIVGIIETHRPCVFSDEYERFKNVPSSYEEWSLSNALNIDRSDLIFFRISGAGVGAIYNDRTRIIDIRDGFYCLESAFSSLFSIRASLSTLDVPWHTIGKLEQVIEALKKGRKGALFLVLKNKCDLTRVSGTVGLRIANSVDYQEHGDNGYSPPRFFHESDTAILVKLASLDGAVCLSTEGRLLSVGEILAPPACAFESMDYGARHNTARRVSHELPDAVVITVSEDGFVTVVQRGEPFQAIEPIFSPEEQAQRRAYNKIWGLPDTE